MPIPADGITSCPARNAAPLARLRASATRYGGASQMRDPGCLMSEETGSAAHHHQAATRPSETADPFASAIVLRCARDTGSFDRISLEAQRAMGGFSRAPPAARRAATLIGGAHHRAGLIRHDHGTPMSLREV